MGNPVSPEKRRYRPVFVVSLLGLLFVCIVAITWVVIATQDVRLAIPLAWAVGGIVGLLKVSMVWLSTPSECKLIARPDRRESLAVLVREVFKGKGAGSSRGQGPPPP